MATRAEKPIDENGELDYTVQDLTPIRAIRKPIEQEQRGRKSILEKNPEIVDDFRKLILMGTSPTAAWRITKIGKTNYYDFMKIGQADFEAGKDTIYSQFFVAVEEASGKLEANLTYTLSKAAKSNPAMIIPFLERRFPETWNKNHIITSDLASRESGNGGSTESISTVRISIVRTLIERGRDRDISEFIEGTATTSLTESN